MVEIGGKVKDVFHLTEPCTRVCEISWFCQESDKVWVTTCPFNLGMEVELTTDGKHDIVSIAPSRDRAIEEIEKRLDLIQKRIRLQEEKKEFMVVEDRSKLNRSVGLKILKYQKERRILQSLQKFLTKTHE